MVTGKTLIELGYKPGKWFKEAIQHANAKKLSGQALIDFLAQISPRTYELLPKARPFYMNIEGFTEEEQINVDRVKKSMEIVMRTPTTIIGTIMPDACPAGPMGSIPVGGVVATDNTIHPAMHSADICCSVMMTSLGKTSPKKILDKAMDITHFGPVFHKAAFKLPTFLKSQLKENPLVSDEKSLSLAESHLGSQGDGNHFLFVGKSKQSEETVLVTHHGSRGLGAYLYSKGIKIAERYRKEISPETLPLNAWIPFDEISGKDYWDALQKVRIWTKYNHNLLHEKIALELGLSPSISFWNEHNFVFKEKNTFFHAKGATPLKRQFIPDDYNGLRLVPLNMAEPILIIRGNGDEKNLGFAPHGAGRNYSRNQHIKKNAQHSSEGLYRRETQGLDIRFYSKQIDISELPSAYKNAQLVKDQIEKFDLGEIVDEIIPYGCIMAGNWRKNRPWKKKN